MKLRNIIYSALAVSALALTSCSDSYLDEKMYSNYGTDVADVEAKLIGLHYKYGALWGMSSRQGFTGIWQDGAVRVSQASGKTVPMLVPLVIQKALRCLSSSMVHSYQIMVV